MRHVDFTALATVIILPARSGQGIAPTARRDVALGAAIEYVLEMLPPAERNRAVVLTRERTLFFEDIRRLHDQPSSVSQTRPADAGPSRAPRSAVAPLTKAPVARSKAGSAQKPAEKPMVRIVQAAPAFVLPVPVVPPVPATSDFSSRE